MSNIIKPLVSMIEIGQKLPEILGKDQDGNEIKLSDFAGKKLVLYVYPKDNTPGCTNQACNLRDNYAELRAAGYTERSLSQEIYRKIFAPVPHYCRHRQGAGGTTRRIWRKKDVWQGGYGHFPHHIHHR